MCTKIKDYKYRIEDAATILDEQFTYVNVIQISFIYNHHQHVSFIDILEKIDLMFYAIQYISDDNRIIRVTVVYDSRKKQARRLLAELKEIEKKYSKGKFKLFIII